MSDAQDPSPARAAPPPTVHGYDEELEGLRNLVGEMGGLAEAQVVAAVDALVRRDAEAGLAVAAGDEALDRLEAEAERMAIGIIARRAPVAQDLRELVAALKISAILERIGDYAKNIGKRACSIAHASPVQPVVIIPEMARLVAAMVRDALDSYVTRDADLAAEIMSRDTRIDDFYNSLFRSLLTYMMENPHHITQAAHLLFIAKNLERIGDHATNIAEMVHFQVTGERGPERPKADATPLFAGDKRGEP
ncbi:MAG: phosphate signaling complex protein PhoU [Sphingomonadaceae bacterium]|uniref:phosphate signaling complex protein PhoU n=1 Tax=Thermaurantiacus sp. TaxID=2820283 RepID=UPI00298EDF03|nr:phosphate signaling complex protein PhoU [Thermaurantiacus sp.]MCS6986722.1 phosphate signaling complex protein PhoU [Sphingomonadaceae bacterium]MDW8414015.1 phosphate signaling complex protein PhoU [Thermaurantiacus sp.]